MLINRPVYQYPLSQSGLCCPYRTIFTNSQQNTCAIICSPSVQDHCVSVFLSKHGSKGANRGGVAECDFALWYSECP